MNLVNAEAPDLVAITGDFATYSRFRSLIGTASRLVAPLRRLHATDGVVAVFGNHDHKTDAAPSGASSPASGVIEARHNRRPYVRCESRLHFCGDGRREGGAAPSP
jgi:predicted MPP superfamily phosphohydrolase